MGYTGQVILTKKNHKKYLSDHHPFISQEDMKKQLPLVIKEHCRESEILFLDEIVIITETLSPLAEKELKRIVKRMGYTAECKNTTMQGKYLYSDGGGHYSTDYYEIIEHARVTIRG